MNVEMCLKCWERARKHVAVEFYLTSFRNVTHKYRFKINVRTDFVLTNVGVVSVNRFFPAFSEKGQHSPRNYDKLCRILLV